MKTGASGLYLGEYEHSLDPQCRITLPSEWRSKEGNTELVLMPTADKALILLPLEVFIEFFDRVKKFAIVNTKLQAAFAYLGSRSRECRCDKQGRLALDRKLLASVGIVSQVTLIGAISHIRLCAPENWTPPEDAAAADYLGALQEFGEGGNALSELLEGLMKK